MIDSTSEAAPSMETSANSNGTQTAAVAGGQGAVTPR
jgi:hypothetical protein